MLVIGFLNDEYIVLFVKNTLKYLAGFIKIKFDIYRC